MTGSKLSKAEPFKIQILQINISIDLNIKILI